MTLDTALVLQERKYDSKSYKLSENKIEGFVDSLEALKQSIYKIIATEQFEYPIYSFRYGIAWKQLIGEEQPYVRAELKRMIGESLARDDRILEVDGFTFEFHGDSCNCSFQVASIYGETMIETEVSL
ncbi:MAG: DUF2634 domain-containing protein [Bacteroides sp.]